VRVNPLSPWRTVHVVRFYIASLVRLNPPLPLAYCARRATAYGRSFASRQ